MTTPLENTLAKVLAEAVNQIAETAKIYHYRLGGFSYPDWYPDAVQALAEYASQQSQETQGAKY